jgi:hypothetical protein
MRGALLSHRAVLFAHDRASDVVYTPLGAAARALSAIFYDTPAEDIIGPGNNRRRHEFEIITPTDFAPSRGDRLSLADQNYVVEQATQKENVGSTLLLVEKR